MTSTTTPSPAPRAPAERWVAVKPAGFVRADTVIKLDRAGNKYRLQTADGAWFDCCRAELDKLLLLESGL